MRDALDRSSPRLSRFASARGLGLAALFALLWLSQLEFPREIASTELDASWCQSLGWALSHRLQLGIDSVFTFGPLGFFATAAYDGDLYWTKVLAWECAFKLLVALVFMRALLRVRGLFKRSLFYFLLVILPLSADAWYSLAIVCAAQWILESAQRERTVTKSGAAAARPHVLAEVPGVLAVVTGVSVLAVLAMVKFTSLLLALAAIVSVAACVWRRSRKRACTMVAGFIALCLVVWLACGQSIGNLPAYVRTSLEISSSYSEAMSIDGRALETVLGAAMFAIMAVLLVLHVSIRPRSTDRLFVAGLLLAASFMAFKSGFVRGQDHPILYFSFASVAPYLLVTSSQASASIAVTSMSLRLACAALGIAGYCAVNDLDARHAPAAFATRWSQAVTRNLRELVDLPGLRARLERELSEKRAAFDLPGIRSRIGAETIDCFSLEQGVLLLNRFNWRPRPVFQGYAAFTPELQALNARFLAGPRAPAFFLFKPGTIDWRLLPMDDAATLQVVTRDYRAVLEESGWMLLEHDPRATSVEVGGGSDTANVVSVDVREPQVDRREPQLDTSIAFDEGLDVNGLAGDCHVLSLDIRYTLWGRLRDFFDKTPPMYAEFRSEDGDLRKARIVPAMMRSGVIVDPIVYGPPRLMRWMRGENLPRLGSFRVLAPESPWMFEPRIGVRYERADALVPRGIR